VALVGTRRASHRGRIVARRLAAELGRLGWTVVSGMAAGIDGAAHRGALEAGCSTVAIMGTGIDVTFPSRHAVLRRDIERTACVVTEEEPGTPPLPFNFPRRNRLIAGLARAVIVVEAPIRSGAMHTAHQAVDMGREVFAVPGPIDAQEVRGCHKLLREGAHLLESVRDVTAVLGLPAGAAPDAAAEAAAGAALPRPGSPARWIWERLDLTGLRLSELRGRWRGTDEVWLEGLTALELAGLIQRLPGGMAARRIWVPDTDTPVEGATLARASKRVRWALEYLLLTAVLALVRILPERWWRGLGRRLGDLINKRFGFRSEVVTDNMRRAMPDLDESGIAALRDAYYLRLGETMLEFFAMSGWSTDEIVARVDHGELGAIRALREQGRGVLLVTGHYGNWELLGAAAAAAGVPMSVVARTQSNPWVDRLQNRIRERSGMKVIKADSSVREVIRAVRRGEMVAMLPDVNAGDDGVFVDFLGRKASTPRGVAYFAWKLKCPLATAFIEADGDGTHTIRAGAIIEPDPEQNENDAVRHLTQQLMDSLGAQIRARPEFYFWVHRRWKTRPPEEREAAHTSEELR